MHDLTATCKKIALNRKVARIYRNMFEAGNEVSVSYSQKNTEVNVFSLAYKMFKQGQAKARLNRSKRNGALSLDIQQAGVELLRSRVEELNAANRAYAKGILGVADNAVLEGADTKDRISSTNRSPI